MNQFKNSHLLLSFLLITLVSLSTAQTCNCNGNGTCPTSINGLCSCYSGFYGSSCDQTARSLGCSFNAVQQLQTLYPFAMNDFSIIGNMVSVSILSPLVTARLNASVFFGGSQGVDTCNYPGSNWNKAISSCQDAYTSTMNWAQVRQCGSWSVDTSSPDVSIYRNNLFAQSTEITGELRGTQVIRSLQYSYPLQVTFQNSILTSSSIRSFAPIVLEASVSNQKVDVAASNGLIELTTSVQWPFKYKNPQMSNIPAGFSITSIEEIGSAAQCPANQPCLQIWRVNFKLNANCQLNGNWNWQFNQSCNPLYTEQCPVPSSGQTDYLITSVVSENYCTVAQIDIGLSATLTSYADAARQEAKAAFLKGQTAYFTIDATSTSASILTTSIDEVVTIAGAKTIFLVQGGNVQTAGGSSSLALSNSVLPNRAQFQFNVNQFSAPVDADQNLDYTVRVKIFVTYSSNQKRALQAEFQVKKGTAQSQARLKFTALAKSSASVIKAASSLLIAVLFLFICFSF